MGIETQIRLGDKNAEVSGQEVQEDMREEKEEEDEADRIPWLGVIIKLFVCSGERERERERVREREDKFAQRMVTTKWKPGRMQTRSQHRRQRSKG